ncbi:MAG: MarR family EPS-associated transcriptional regulator [Gammaproteobacteria bacterium]|nr:MarR family EPS-associated transcriptional regulator [Gammaproteobacteria bacterium]|tara:strand:- start:965 stop:1306 length:342 start_codon:yes stop_codon:yes gene_type:complete
MPVLNEEDRYQLLKLLETNPDLSQREIAKSLGISLGKANFCLKALIEKGLIKAKRFKSSSSKRSYLYLLTLKGIEEKGRITLSFLARKQAEYSELVREIEMLKAEVKNMKENQ